MRACGGILKGELSQGRRSRIDEHTFKQDRKGRLSQEAKAVLRGWLARSFFSHELEIRVILLGIGEQAH